MAAALIKVDEIESVTVDPDGALIVLSRHVTALPSVIPRLAQREPVRLLRGERRGDSQVGPQILPPGEPRLSELPLRI